MHVIKMIIIYSNLHKNHTCIWVKICNPRMWEGLFACVSVCVYAQFRIKKRNPGYKEIQPSGDESNDPRMEQKSNKICPEKLVYFSPGIHTNRRLLRRKEAKPNIEKVSQPSSIFIYSTEYIFILRTKVYYINIRAYIDIHYDTKCLHEKQNLYLQGYVPN